MKWLWPAVVAGVATWSAAVAFHRGFEYDELWTLNHYAQAESARVIFTDLTVPNNHPLHSLLVRWSVASGGAAEWVVRLPAWLAGVALWIAIPLVTRELTGDRQLAFVTGLLCAASAPLFHFSHTARGYGLQTLGVVAFVGAVAASRRDIRWLAAAPVAGLAALLTLPTTILFVAPVLVADWVARRRDRAVWLAHGSFCLLAGVWVWFGAAQWSQGREAFGIPVESVLDWLRFAGGVIVELWGLWLPAFMLLALVAGNHRKLAWLLAAMIAWPLLAAALTRAGPARAYVPLVPAGILLAALGMRQLGRWQWAPVGVAVVLLPGHLRQWTPPDWRAIAPALGALASPLYINYRPTDGYVVQHYFGDAALGALPDAPAITIATVGGMAGMDLHTHRTVELGLPPQIGVKTARVQGVEILLVRAERIRDPASGDDRLMFLAGEGPIPPAVLDWGWVRLNGFFPRATPVVLARRGAVGTAEDGIRLYQQIAW